MLSQIHWNAPLLERKSGVSGFNTWHISGGCTKLLGKGRWKLFAVRSFYFCQNAALLLQSWAWECRARTCECIFWKCWQKGERKHTKWRSVNEYYHSPYDKCQQDPSNCHQCVWCSLCTKNCWFHHVRKSLWKCQLCILQRNLVQRFQKKDFRKHRFGGK